MAENVTSAGWQATLCDPIWYVSSCSGDAYWELLYSVSLSVCLFVCLSVCLSTTLNSLPIDHCRRRLIKRLNLGLSNQRYPIAERLIFSGAKRSLKFQRGQPKGSAKYTMHNGGKTDDFPKIACHVSKFVRGTCTRYFLWQEAQLPQRDRASTLCQLKSCQLLQNCTENAIKKRLQ